MIRKAQCDPNSEKLKLKKKAHYIQNQEKIKDARKHQYITKVKEKRANMSMLGCLSSFIKAIIWGSIYPCICCHRACFRNGVKRANLSNLQKFSIYNEAVDTIFLQENLRLFAKGSLWICHNCNLYITKQKKCQR